MGSHGSVASAPIASSKAGGIRQFLAVLISLAVGGIFIFVGYWLAIIGTTENELATHEGVYGLWKIKTTYPVLGWIAIGVGGLIALAGILIALLSVKTNVNRPKASSNAGSARWQDSIEKHEDILHLPNYDMPKEQVPQGIETVSVVDQSPSSAMHEEPVRRTETTKQIEVSKPEEPHVIKLTDEILSAHDRADILEEMCQQVGIHRIMSSESKNLSDGEKTILRKKHGGKLSGRVVFPISEAVTEGQGEEIVRFNDQHPFLPIDLIADAATPIDIATMERILRKVFKESYDSEYIFAKLRVTSKKKGQQASNT